MAPTPAGTHPSTPPKPIPGAGGGMTHGTWNPPEKGGNPPKQGGWPGDLTGPQRDAYAALLSLFTSYGLASLAPKIFDYVKQGYSSDTISLLLQDTKEYKDRFAANEIRKKQGLRVLTPAEYLSLEDSYRQYMAQAGLPKGFYDQNSDFTNYIANDVSPTEVKDRVDMAVQATTQANVAYKQALQQMYGLSDKDLAAYFLDPKRAEPLLQKQAAAAQIGAAALQRGFDVNKNDFESFASEGVTASQAQQGFAYIADTFQTIRDIASRYGTDWSQLDAERDVFEPGKTPGSNNSGGYTGESVTEKKNRLIAQEKGLFSGNVGSSVGGLSSSPGF